MKQNCKTSSVTVAIGLAQNLCHQKTPVKSIDGSIIIIAAVT